LNFGKFVTHSYEAVDTVAFIYEVQGIGYRAWGLGYSEFLEVRDSFIFSCHQGFIHMRGL